MAAPLIVSASHLTIEVTAVQQCVND